jgi:hypothetical protein
MVASKLECSSAMPTEAEVEQRRAERAAVAASAAEETR